MRISRQQLVCFVTGFACALHLPVRSARADVIQLSNGGEIRGQIETAVESADRTSIKTLTDGRIVILTESVERISRRRRTVEEYETLAKRIENTLEGHWELAQWCRANRLTPQRNAHLQRVVEFDPEHKLARKGARPYSR